jgi:pimeloyl-ACP methyl ester carboxylesterase
MPTPAMPPVQYANPNGIRMAYYEAGPKDLSLPPVVLCHGWPELAYSWRHQLAQLSAAGLRVIAPDQRGYGLSDRPEPVEAYDLEQLTADLAGLLDHLKVPKAIFAGHDWGGFVVWQMGMRHPSRTAGVIGVNTPHRARLPEDPIAIFRKRFGDSMYIVQFQSPAREPDRIFAANVEKTFRFFMRRPFQGQSLTAPPAATGAGNAPGGIGAAPTVNLAFPQIVQRYDPAMDPREEILSPDELKLFVDTYTRTGFTGGINWYRNFTRNWERSAHLDHTIRVPSLMIMAEKDVVLPPSAADGMEAIVPDLEKHLVRGSGHWTQQEKPDEVSRVIADWVKRRFGT